VLIRSDAYPGRIFDGKVQQITPKGDPVARSYRVRISLPAHTPLMIGMTTETNIVLRRSEDALLLPAGAVQQDKAWRVENGRLHPNNVTVGCAWRSSGSCSSSTFCYLNSRLSRM
jgi:multidrug efflux pump subunit AcrA (membrane-fusion protein)